METTEERRAGLDNAATEQAIAFRKLRDEHATLAAEIASLEGRRSNLPARVVAIRDRLAAEVGVLPERLPFAGELIQVRPEARDWEGAAERLLHGFALSLLVPDDVYGQVADFVDRTHLAERLVYFRVRAGKPAAGADLHPRSLVRKLALKTDSPFYGWLDREVSGRFDYVCCDGIDALRREERGVTRLGQTKGRGERHEKDDRHRIDDRTRYVLGWSNADKIRALKAVAKALEPRIADAGRSIAAIDTERKSISQRLSSASQLKGYASFVDLDWRSIALKIEALQVERRQLEEGSDTLRTLQAQLGALVTALASSQNRLDALVGELGGITAKREALAAQLASLAAEIAGIAVNVREREWPRLEAWRGEALGEQRLIIESCDNRAQDMREWLQAKIDAEDKRLARLRDAIVRGMQAYCRDNPAETREVDASIESAAEFKRFLDALAADDLPRFENRFKTLLNEQTINEVAGFQSGLNKERQLIAERIGLINQSLAEIDYNTGRFIELIVENTLDPDVRQFRQDLRACTEDTLTGSEQGEYSEAKFLQVKQIIERFKGRATHADLDRKWTRKVTDVRNWFVFSASERWREDGREHEHYTDSGGKSGGQKEKLAYTVLAASLAYQFGIDWRAQRSRSFHFVVIDEAFGRGSDESAHYGLDLFRKMNLQLLVATPLQKIHIIEPFVSAVGFVHNEDGKRSLLRNLTIDELRAERLKRAG